MADVSVKSLAETVGTPVERLLGQLVEAGVGAKSADDLISPAEKVKLLTFLRESHGRGSTATSTKKVTLKRKTLTTLKVGGQGRGKTVNVEVRKKRTIRKPVADSAEVKLDTEEEALKAVAETKARHVEAEVAKVRDAEQAVVDEKAAEEARIQAEKDAAVAAEEAAARKVIEDQMLQKAEKVALKHAEKEVTKMLAAEKERVRAEKEAEKKRADAAAQAALEARKSGGRNAAPRPGAGKTRSRGGAPDKKLHVAPGKSGRRGAKGKGKGKGRRIQAPETKHAFEKPVTPVIHEVELSETITVGELAQRMAVKANEVIKTMMGMGVMATINQSIDQDTATLIVEEMGHTVKLVSDNEKEEQILRRELTGDEVTRPAVVTIMGHVDHGKTSLLDYIRSTKVTDGEAGGITQHIGAYHVDTPKGTLTFLDTPGHAAFSAMRARGANVTDIVVIVVAADDGVMPQTVEAIKHARAAGAPLIIAVNKMDKEGADPDRVKTEMSQHDVLPEDWGGDVMFIPLSAHTGEGIDDLLDALTLQSEMLELAAIDTGPARGIVIESRLDKGRGPVASVLVQEGMLKKGDIVLAGQEFGRVRSVLDENGKPTDAAGPSMPVEILGLSGSPAAGEEMLVVANERQAREVASAREAKTREAKLAAQQAAKLESMFDNMKANATLIINVMIKADVQGSVEAITHSLMDLSTDDIRVNVVSGGVGGLTENDINLAEAANAVVIAFNVRADAKSRRMIQDVGLDVRYYSIIYDVIDDVRLAMSGMLGSEIREEFIGLAEVKDVFRSSKLGAIAGCMVIEGNVKRSAPIRVLRDNVVIYEGELESLRRFKDEAESVRNGTECGIGVKNYNDVQVGDQIECFEHIEVQRTL